LLKLREILIKVPTVDAANLSLNIGLAKLRDFITNPTLASNQSGDNRSQDRGAKDVDDESLKQLQKAVFSKFDGLHENLITWKEQVVMMYNAFVYRRPLLKLLRHRWKKILMRYS